MIASSKSKLANLLKSEFGGRRCEIINLTSRPDLIGKTCVVDKFMPNKGRYKVTFEASKEAGLVGPENLKRRDRTPDDADTTPATRMGGLLVSSLLQRRNAKHLWHH